MQTVTSIVAATGVGKRDYSQAVEYASQSSIRGHQLRVARAASWTLATEAYPDIWLYIDTFRYADGTYHYLAPATPANHYYNITFTSERNALCYVGLSQFATWADIFTYTVEKHWGYVWGYGIAELDYSVGVKALEGKYYGVEFGESSEEATFTGRTTDLKLVEDIIHG